MANCRSKEAPGRDSMNAIKEFLIACGLSVYAITFVILALQFFGAAK
jgi:hypothetical protein